jgi:predicted dehydrogenase
MAGKRLGIGVIGAGRCANWAHLPGWARDERCRIVGVCDTDPERAAAAAGKYGADVATGDYAGLLARDDIDIIDVVTRDSEHFEINCAAIEAGKHVLSEKPVAHDHHDVARVAAMARERGLKTKVGFTFRYSPGASSSHWFMESDLTAVVGVLRNFIPERIAASTGALTRFNIDDGDIFLGEFASGAICSVQSSFVTVGNYPGIEVRVYGSEGAAITRLVEDAASARRCASPRRTRWSSARSRSRRATTRRAAARASPGGPSTTPTSPRTSPARCSASSPGTRATSTTGCGCSR